MSLIELDKGIYVIPEDVVSLEDHSYWEGCSPSGEGGTRYYGSVMTLKNGRKIYLKSVTAKDAFEKLNSKTPAKEGSE